MSSYFPITNYIDAEVQPGPTTTYISIAGENVDDLKALIAKDLLGFWQEILGIKDISPEDNFFDLGGHSLIATQLYARVRSAFGIELDAKQIFDSPTINELAECINGIYQHNDTQHTWIQPRSQKNGHGVLSFAEARMLFLTLLEPDQPTYNLNGYFCTEGYDLNILEQSLNYVIARHEILRATYDMVDGEPVRTITPFIHFTLPIVDLTAVPEEIREAEAKRLMTLEAAQLFNLKKGPLFRFIVYKITETKHIHFSSMHHIITDGWSSGILGRDILLAYAALRHGATLQLPPLPIQYADFASWQRQWMASEVMRQEIGYWKQQLRGPLPVVELPTDRPRPKVLTYNGEVMRLKWTGPFIEEIHRFNKRENVTLFMTLMAGLAVLCYRYTKQTDIIIGTPVANRRHVELENLVGLFINTLALRIDLSGNPTFREVVHRTAQTALEAYNYQDVPFDRLVQELQVRRDTSRSPIYSIMFVMQNGPAPLRHIPGLGEASGAISNGTAKFDLVLDVEELAGELWLSIEYNTDLFDFDTVERLVGHYQILMEHAVIAPEQLISAIPILGEAEQNQLLVEWNATQMPYTKMASIHKLFSSQVKHTPDAVALIFGDQLLTYREVEQRANQVAHELQMCGVMRGTIVGICLEPGPLVVIVILGIMKAGGAYLPLDPSYPGERLRLIASDAHLQFVLTQSAHVQAINALAKVTINIDASWESITQRPVDPPVDEVGLDDLAYVLYTSGSTGTPKGVMGMHRGMVNRFCWMWQTYPFLAGEVCCQKTTPGFVDSIWEIFGPLLQGIPLVIAPRQVAQDVEQLVELLASHKVTRLVLVPSLLRAMLEMSPDMKTRLPHLALVTVSGETMPSELVTRFFAAMPGTRLLNLYGSTEVAADVSYYELTPNNPPLIGRPIANAQLYVLSEEMTLVPIGVPGELYVGGVGLARGYLNHPEITREKFVDVPCLPSEKLYRTGDLVRYRSDGNLEILGRTDFQVKVRGMRVAIEEVEIALRRHPTVKQAAVVDQPDSQGYIQLVAFIVVTDDAHFDPRTLQKFLQDLLPSHMVPTGYGVLPALPTTSSGKIDRRTLRTLPVYQPERKSEHETPRDSVEASLCTLWEQVLNRPVSITDNFFDMGGHSLLAVHLFTLIERKFGRRIPLALLFQTQTVDKMAELIKRDAAPALPGVIVPMQLQGNKPPLFLLHNLGGGVSWYAKLVEYLEPGHPIYGIQPVGFDGTDQPLARVEDMAAAYIAAIRSVQSEGPYYLIGASFGGILAYEVAQQLLEQGQHVKLLAVLDTRVDYQEPLTFIRRVIYRTTAEISHIHQLTVLPPAKKVDYVRAGIKRIRRRLNARSWQEWYSDELLPATLANVLNMTLAAQVQYRPRPYAGRVVLFLATGQLGLTKSLILRAWKRLAFGGVQIIHVPGDHRLLAEPYVREVALLLSNYLKTIESDNADN